MSLLVRPAQRGDKPVVIDITPESAGWRYVGFRVVQLKEGERYDGGDPGREACLVLLTGTANVMADGKTFEKLGCRSSVFEGGGPAVYVPAGTLYTVIACNDLEFAVCTAPGTGARNVRVILPVDMTEETRGHGTNKRYIRNILPESSDIADSLLVVEVITPGGHWSSYPPHKHDRDAFPEESYLEETYYHRLSPPQGFAFQRVYTDDHTIDETMSVADGDVVMVPRGYHPVGAPHGYDLYYLNVMAGPARRWIFVNDPAHDWIVNQAKKHDTSGE